MVSVREAAGGGGTRDTESKTRTPHKDVGKYNLAWHPYRLEEQSITTSQQLAAARRQPQVKSCMIAHCEVRSIKMIFNLFVVELWQPGFVLNLYFGVLSLASRVVMLSLDQR